MTVSDGVSPSPKGGPEPARPPSKSATEFQYLAGDFACTRWWISWTAIFRWRRERTFIAEQHHKQQDAASDVLMATHAEPGWRQRWQLWLSNPPSHCHPVSISELRRCAQDPSSRSNVRRRTEHSAGKTKRRINPSDEGEAVWQWQPKIVQTVQRHRLVWISLDT